MEQVQQRSEPTLLPLPARMLCAKCVHGASVILDRLPLCGDCFLTESRKETQESKAS
jgi:hypothetical protein